MSEQFQDPVSLPTSKELLVPTVQEAGHVPETVLKFCRRQESSAAAGNGNATRHSVHRVITVPTTLAWLPISVTYNKASKISTGN